MRHLIFFFRVAFSLLVIGLAAVAVAILWDSYMLAPWTRDARVLAQVVDIAPEVPGTIVAVPLQDGQLVRQGATLFALDPVRFRLALAGAEAALAAARQALAQAHQDARRRQGLDGVVSAEAAERAATADATAAAALQGALAARDLAALNLARSVLYAPVDGYVTHLRLRVGDYAAAGQPRLALVDAHSFWVTGYFEETKLARVAVGAPARIKLMGWPQPLLGHVESIGRGIADPDDAVTPRGLPTVNPVFTWVRLAQRVPVRIAIDQVPRGVTLVSGLTASVAVGAALRPPGLRAAATEWIRDHL